MQKILLIFPIFLSLLMTSISILGITSNIYPNILILIILICLTASILLTRNMAVTSIKNVSFFQTFLILLLSTLPILLIANFPPLTWDEIAYSASLPRAYAEKKHFFYNSAYGPYSAFPQNYEAITTASFILFKTPILSKLINYFSAILIGLITFNIIMLQKGKAEIATTIAVITVILGTFLSNVSLIKNDIVVAILQGAAVLYFVNYCRTKNKIYLLAISLVLGAAIGAKYSAAFFSIAMTLVLSIETTKENISFREKASKILLFIGMLIIFSSPWYLNNLYLFSNPFYPAFNSVFPQNQFNATYMQLLYENTRTLNGFTFTNGTLFEFLKTIYDLNHILFSGAILGILLSYRLKTGETLKPIRNLLFIFVSILFFFGFWANRYYLVLIILLAPFCYLLTEKFSALKEFLVKNNSKILALFMFLSFFSLSSKFSGQIYNRIKLTEVNFIEKYYGDYKLAKFVNENLNSNDTIAIANTQPFYYLDAKYYHIHFLNELGNLSEKLNEDKSFKSFIKEQKINYFGVRFNTNDPTYKRNLAPLLFNWNDQLFLRMKSLEKSKTIKLISVINSDTNNFSNNIYVYKLNIDFNDL
jgi:hypothetical protein